MADPNQTQNNCPNCSRKAISPWLAVLAAASVTTAAVLVARKVRHCQVAQSVEDLDARCDDAASALDARMSGNGLSLAG